MPSSPLILLVHKMHGSGIDLLRRPENSGWPAVPTRKRSSAKLWAPEALVIRTGGVIDAPPHGRGQGLEGHRPAWRRL